MLANCENAVEQRRCSMNNQRGFTLVGYYSHISIKYAVFIKQVIAQMVFAKFNRQIIEKTKQALEYMQVSNGQGQQDTIHKINQSEFDRVYQKIVLDHIVTNSREIWDESFAEHNTYIVLRYFIDIINHLFVYSDNTTTSDPKYTYSQETIRMNLYGKYSRVIYPPEPYEPEKQVRNSIIHDVLVYIIEQYEWQHLHICEYDAATRELHYKAFNPKPFYIYLGHYARRLIQQDKTHIFNEDGALDITESLLQKYAPQTTTTPTITTTYYEIYTIWLLYMWLR
jgi:hypothetical protein